ncbi:hypothetical protein VXE65_22685 [Mycolicibacterium conceptionense]|uniref:hypothetical protein n=1 Tax=Mycolicibacterium conceptionense TaxID=451644 RepID=UPI0032049310
MTPRVSPPTINEPDDEYGQPSDHTDTSITWSEIAATAAVTATPRTWAEIAASAADSANSSAESAHRSAISALDAATRTNPPATSGSSSGVNPWSLWSLWFFVLGILLGALLTLAAIMTDTRAVEGKRIPGAVPQRVVVTEYPWPQPLSPTNPHRLQLRPT